MASPLSNLEALAQANVTTSAEADNNRVRCPRSNCRSKCCLCFIGRRVRRDDRPRMDIWPTPKP